MSKPVWSFGGAEKYDNGRHNCEHFILNQILYNSISEFHILGYIFSYTHITSPVNLKTVTARGCWIRMLDFEKEFL